MIDFDRIARLGGYATVLMADESFKDVIRGLKDEAIVGWSNAKSVDEREAFWRDLRAVGNLESKLKTLGETYRVEMSKQAAEKKKQERAAYREGVDRV